MIGRRLKLRHRIVNGRRGAYLATAAAAHLAIGVSYLTTPTDGRNAAFSWLPPWFGMPEIGLVLVSCSFAVLVLSLGWPMLPQWSEDLAFGLLATLPLALLFVFAGAMFLGASSTAWISVIIYSSYAATVWIVSGWPNPPTRARDEVEGVEADA